jgi:hypothetical protein
VYSSTLASMGVRLYMHDIVRLESAQTGYAVRRAALLCVAIASSAPARSFAPTE